MNIIAKALEEAVLRVADEVDKFASEGIGKDVMGPVLGRPEYEDLEIAIDSVCDRIFVESLSGLGVTIKLYSEHGSQLIGKGDPAYIVTVDPLDGSGLYRRNIPAEWWTVASYFDSEEEVLGAVAVDIIRKELYIADSKNVWMSGIDKENPQEIRSSDKVNVDNDLTLAAYLMDPVYLQDWIPKTTNMLSKYPGIRIWPNGGSCIYPWMSRGLIDVYLMFNEPRSEIDPGIGFARTSGIGLFEVTESGSVIPYKFLQNSQAERVPIFLAASTQSLAQKVAENLFS